MRIRIRAVLFALVTAGSLGFGTSQALATPAGASECDEWPWIFTTSSCPGPNTVDCDAECAARGWFDGGWCRNNCCTCAI